MVKPELTVHQSGGLGLGTQNLHKMSLGRFKNLHGCKEETPAVLNIPAWLDLL